ncbi:MAG TPA: hypothetical protein DD670_03065 [Planctomycetaceae bacterium]|nr:hypothetical protein [Planctomycetaceae bacterium]
MDVKLVVLGGKNAGRIIPITVEKFFIGRAEDCHLRPNTDLVSRHHCAITVDSDEVTVRDFGSRNGTLVNGERIRGEEELKAGDRLAVGPLEFEIRIEVALTAAKKPKVETIEQAAARTVETAAAKSAKKELDIADWLADTVDGGGDTQSIEKVPGGDTAMSPPPAAEDQTAAQEAKDREPVEEQKKEPRRSSPSGVHGLKGPKSIDSKSAAADTLRAFFNRK